MDTAWNGMRSVCERENRGGSTGRKIIRCPIDNIDRTVESFNTKGMSLYVAKSGLAVPAGTHAHGTYELLIPMAPMSFTHVEKKKTPVADNQFLVFNAGQDHGNIKQVSDCLFSTIEIERKLLRQISGCLGGRGEINFRNECQELTGDMRNLLRIFIEESRNRPVGYEFVLESLRTHFIVSLLRQVKNNLPLPGKEHRYDELENIQRAIDFLHDQYNQNFSLNDVAREAHLSPYHFIRVFKTQTGKTPHEYLLEIKIDKARQLLGSGDHTITEICFLCGFNTPTHFTTAFRKKTGVSPSEYRRAMLSGLHPGRRESELESRRTAPLTEDQERVE